MDAPIDRLRRFIEEKCLIHRPGIRLASGRISNYYLDCRVAVMDPTSLPLIAEILFDRIVALPELPSAIGGAIVGAVPITAAVVQHSAARRVPLSGFMVRREVKQHGTQQKIENAPPRGTKVAIVEDVVTTGASAAELWDLTGDAGAERLGVASIIDRSTAPVRFPLRAVVRVEATAWEADACPLCAAGRPFDAPGSRHMQASR